MRDSWNPLHMTPVPVLRTFLGSPLFSTSDIVEEIAAYPFACQTELTCVMNKDFGSAALKLICQVPEKPSILSLRHMLHGLVACSANTFGIRTNCGVKNITIDEFLKRVQIDNSISSIIAPADEIPLNSTLKRADKAYERTMRWFKQVRASPVLTRHDGSTSEIFLFGVVMPHPKTTESDTLKHRLQLSTRTLLDEGANGLVVGGLGCGESVEELVSAIAAVRTEIVSTRLLSVPVLVQGMDSAATVLLAIYAGADLVAGDFPGRVSSAGMALAWDLSERTGTDRYAAVSESGSSLRSTAQLLSLVKTQWLPAVGTTAVASSRGGTVVQGIRGSKRARERDEGLGGDGGDEEDCSSDLLARSAAVKSEEPPGVSVINLWHERYTLDKRPLLAGCKCHACRSHSRAYIHHLLITHELLGEVLLHAHNNFQLMQLFARAREVKQGYTDATREGANPGEHSITAVNDARFQSWIASVLQQV